MARNGLRGRLVARCDCVLYVVILCGLLMISGESILVKT